MLNKKEENPIDETFRPRIDCSLEKERERKRKHTNQHKNTYIYYLYYSFGIYSL